MALFPSETHIGREKCTTAQVSKNRLTLFFASLHTQLVKPPISQEWKKLNQKGE